MLDIDFSKNGVSVISKNDTAHWVEEHFKHALWSEGGSNNICNSLGCFDVSLLCFLALLTLGVFV
jgi:hypothetical protein